MLQVIGDCDDGGEGVMRQMVRGGRGVCSRRVDECVLECKGNNIRQ